MEQTSEFVRRESDMADHLDNGVVGLHWASADGVLLWANRADYEPLGYTPEEYVGHHAAEFHADHTALGDMWQRLSKGETIYNYPALHDGAGGSADVGGERVHLLVGWKRVLEDGLERHEGHRGLRPRRVVYA